MTSTALGYPVIPAPGGGGGAIVPLSHTRFVDVATTIPPVDQDGSIARPFASIALALASIIAIPPAEAVNIIVGPGDLTEQVVWPARNNLSLIGSGTDTTVLIAPPGATAALSFTPAPGTGTATRRLNVKNLSIFADQIANPGQRCIELIAAEPGFTALGDGAFFDQVNLSFAGPTPSVIAYAKNIGGLYVLDSWWGSSVALGGAGNENVSIDTITTALFDNSRIGILTTRYDDSDPNEPSTGRSIYQIMNGTQIETQWRMEGHPICAATEDTVIRGSVLSPYVDGSVPGQLFNGTLPSHTPQIYLSGTVGLTPGGSGVILTFPDQAPTPSICSLISGNFLQSVLVEVAAGATRMLVPAYGANFLSSAVAGELTDLDLRMAKYEQTSIGVIGVLPGTGGAIDRTNYVIGAVPFIPGANAIPIPYPPAVGGFYAIAAIDLSGPPGANISFPMGGQSNVAFTTAGGVGVGAVTYTILRP